MIKQLLLKVQALFFVITLSVLTSVSLHAASDATPQLFTITDHLSRQWTNELIHVDAVFPSPVNGSLTVTVNGKEVPFQLTNIKREAKGALRSVRIWTVLTLPANGKAIIRVAAADKVAKAPKTAVSVKKEGEWITLSNDVLALRLSNLVMKPDARKALEQLPVPLSSVQRSNGKWIGQGKWITDKATPQVKAVKTTVLDSGPVFARVRQDYSFVNGAEYSITFKLAMHQDAATVEEICTLTGTKTAFRLDLTDRLNPTHVYWHVQQGTKTATKGDTRQNTKIDLASPGELLILRPWAYWWLTDLSMWAAFYRDGGEYLGVLMLRPSQWTPIGWDGFKRTQVSVSVTDDKRVGMTFPLGSAKPKETLKRQWAITTSKYAAELTPTDSVPLIRRQLVKYSEWPLDKVKDFGFDFTPSDPDRSHPFLLFTKEDIDRARKQAKTDPAIARYIERHRNYVMDRCHSIKTFENEGWEAFYKKNYWGNYQVESLPAAYVGLADPAIEKLMVAALKGWTKKFMDMMLNEPVYGGLGRHGPWASGSVMTLALYYDAMASSTFLSPEDKQAARNALVLGAHFLDHPDYWNTDVSLCSANPNMTNSIRVPQGMLALLLDGHPNSSQWLKAAEDELKRELKDWVSPGGAWIENPGYQMASIDSLLMLGLAIRNVQGRDYFADPKFKETMDYFGFLLTPPDKRFPSMKTGFQPIGPPSTLPAIGDMFAGAVSFFNGMMAKATADTDPDYSARQQFYWRAQQSYLGRGGRMVGFTPALVDANIIPKPPKELSKSFPGFGSVMRNSWTNPEATYIAHRTGPYYHHYHDDYNSIVLYAKGAPLCPDFGNYSGTHRWESWYHSRVSWSTGKSGKRFSSTGNIIEFQSLPSMVDYSYGLSKGGGKQKNHRHILMLKSDDVLGANYLVVRDTTEDGQPKQDFYWNLWCLSKKPQINGKVVHFPGQLGVDLDLHILSPSKPQITTDEWNWKVQIYVWRHFSEQQHGVRIKKAGSKEDFFTVLYPRTGKEKAAKVTTLAKGKAVKVEHSEGTDIVLLSPTSDIKTSLDDTRLEGRIAFARSYTDGRQRLAVIKGKDALVRSGDWELKSSGPTAINIKGKHVTGESSGNAHTVQLTLPADYGAAKIIVDGQAAKGKREGHVLTFKLPSGNKTFSVNPQ